MSKIYISVVRSQILRRLTWTSSEQSNFEIFIIKIYAQLRQLPLIAQQLIA